jgi:hypothetical protein
LAGKSGKWDKMRVIVFQAANKKLEGKKMKTPLVHVCSESFWVTVDELR